MRSNLNAGKSSLRSQGVSLIEGVVVISLVGIISAFAVPRFTRLANAARSSEVQALGIYLQKAVESAHAQYLAAGSHLATATIEGRTVSLRNGYPDAGQDGIRNAVFAADGFMAGEDGAFITFSRSDAPLRNQCSVTYHLPVDGGTATIKLIDTSGC
jgi:MSHA pilin protein MshA